MTVGVGGYAAECSGTGDLARLRNRRFSSLEELNTAIREW